MKKIILAKNRDCIKTSTISALYSLVAITLLPCFAHAQSKLQKDTLATQFKTPPNAAKPRVWWHWMNGNITKDGIKKDLEWMHRSGIGGFQNFDADLSTPQVVDKRLGFMTTEWKDAFGYAVHLADSLNLEMAIASSPGWSETGGPWVSVKDGMKKIVWSELRINGGKGFSGILPQPPVTTGPFQNIPFKNKAERPNAAKIPKQYYEDIAVIAYKLPTSDILLADLKPIVTSSSGNFSLEQLTNGDLNTSVNLSRNGNMDSVWIQFEFPKKQVIKTVTLAAGGTKPRAWENNGAIQRYLYTSDNGTDFRMVADLPLGTIEQQTLNIPETNAKYYRIVFRLPQNISQVAVTELVLHPVTRINHSEVKAGFTTSPVLTSVTTSPTTEIIRERDIVDLSHLLKKDGSISWQVPEGKWLIQRFGYSLTGKENHPASLEATGLEVDKMDSSAVRKYFEHYLDLYKSASNGKMGKKGLQYIIMDSYEAGQENWTPKMSEEFHQRRGYSLIPWLPVISGKIIASSEASERFLWDWRKTVSELVAENHYDQATKILAKYEMKRYTESHENVRAFVADGMDVKRTADVPMSAMWVNGHSSKIVEQADIRESASVAHIYGQNIVAAESFTANGSRENSAWAYHPANLKPFADLQLASGLNRFVIHTSVHQPVDDKIPGLGLGKYGQWFTRHETWANLAKAWTNYLARSSYLLQQGKFVADIVYYYGEDNNITGLYGNKLPTIPKGYNFDFINTHALLSLLDTKNGVLTTPSGMEYTILVLDSNTQAMPLTVLKKIVSLVEKGAVVIGPKPIFTPSLKDNTVDFKQLTEKLWGKGHGVKTTGKGKVISGESIEKTLLSLNTPPDFAYKTKDTAQLLFVHRKMENTDIYWVNNREEKSVAVELSFRANQNIPELWRPETGEVESLSYEIVDNKTVVHLTLDPNDAIFIVFRQKSTTNKVELPIKNRFDLAVIDGTWEVSFQKDRGAPLYEKWTKLDSWTNHPNQGIKYFSGTATYAKNISVKKEWIAQNKRLLLDLGDVKNLAEVTVNGQPAGIVWKHPFIIDITGLLKNGKNSVDIKVANLWVNRLIGDTQPGISEKITYTTMPFYKADSKLLPSGLLGPVKIIAQN